MRIIKEELIVKTIEKLFHDAARYIPCDVEKAIIKKSKNETSKMAKLALNKFTQIWDEEIFSPKGQLGMERCEGHVNIEKDFS